MEEQALGLILDHESEHLEAGDLRLLVLASVFPVVFPWSLPTWWMWHRLRLAVEGDCDLRVLKRNPLATRAYMELLLSVGRRLPQGRVAAAMLSEPERTLARRIRTMTTPIPRRPFLRGVLLIAVGALLIGVACAVPGPLAVEEEAVLPGVQAAVEGSGPATSDPAGQLMEEPTFTPFTVRPDITNRATIARALEAEYAPLLRDAGIGGTATVWFFIDETGSVQRVLLNESSGHEALDEAALRVAGQIEFTPALNRDERVAVWISLPISFSVREEETATPAPPLPDTRPGGDAAQSPTFTPFTVRPDITNRATVARAMEAEYPPLLREAGIGGTATVWFFIDETGSVQRVLLNESSGHEALDEAALRVAGQIEFTPALNRDERVAVWIALPITFTTR
jgi:TonB family protein